MTSSSAYIFKDIVKSLGNEFSINTSSNDWVTEIIHKGKKMLIYGYDFPFNSASATKLCRDKAACSEFLFNYNIPCVEHFALTPDMSNKEIRKICDTLGYPIIVKDNNGTCGKDIFRVVSFGRVIHNAEYLWEKNKQVCICAEENISDEYRLVFLDGEMLLCYKKIVPSIVGDGVLSIGELIEAKNIMLDGKAVKFNLDYTKKLNKGERLNLSWKRNLCLGSSPFIINKPDPRMIYLAQRAIYNLDIKFCSVDIIRLKNGELKILEINAGVMMRYLAQCENVNGYQLAFDVYKKAILEYFK